MNEIIIVTGFDRYFILLLLLIALFQLSKWLGWWLKLIVILGKKIFKRDS